MARLKLTGEPLLIINNQCLVAFDDQTDPPSYMQGLLFVKLTDDNEIASTEGVRKKNGKPDLEGMYPDARDLVEQTMDLVVKGGNLPFLSLAEGE